MHQLLNLIRPAASHAVLLLPSAQVQAQEAVTGLNKPVWFAAGVAPGTASDITKQSRLL